MSAGSVIIIIIIIIIKKKNKMLWIHSLVGMSQVTPSFIKNRPVIV